MIQKIKHMILRWGFYWIGIVAFLLTTIELARQGFYFPSAIMGGITILLAGLAEIDYRFQKFLRNLENLQERLNNVTEQIPDDAK